MAGCKSCSNRSPDMLTKPLEKAAGVRTYNTFIKGTFLCSVERSDKIYFIPYRNGGYKGDDRGFHETGDEQISVSTNSSNEKIGLSALETLEKCK